MINIKIKNNIEFTEEFKMVFEKIRDIIADQLGVEADKITLETKVKDDLNADSLDLFQIISEIEDEFEDATAIVTVADAVKFVEENK